MQGKEGSFSSRGWQRLRSDRWCSRTKLIGARRANSDTISAGAGRASRARCRRGGGWFYRI